MMEYELIEVDECDVSTGDDCYVICKGGKTLAHGEGRNPIGLAKDILGGWEIKGIGIVVETLDKVVAIKKEP